MKINYCSVFTKTQSLNHQLVDVYLTYGIEKSKGYVFEDGYQKKDFDKLVVRLDKYHNECLLQEPTGGWKDKEIFEATKDFTLSSSLTPAQRDLLNESGLDFHSLEFEGLLKQNHLYDDVPFSSLVYYPDREQERIVQSLLSLHNELLENIIDEKIKTYAEKCGKYLQSRIVNNKLYLSHHLFMVKDLSIDLPNSMKLLLRKIHAKEDELLVHQVMNHKRTLTFEKYCTSKF